MRKFVRKYIDRFKNIKNALENNNPKPKAKVGAAFCNGKTKISNAFLKNFSWAPLNDFKTQWGSGGLVINGTNIEYFFDGNKSYTRMVACYMAKMHPEEDSRDYYFQYLADLKKVDSYPQLPVPAGVNKYSEWLDAYSPYPWDVQKPSRPACIEVVSQSNSSGTIVPGFTQTDAIVSNPDVSSPYASVNDYDRPGLKNIYFYKGYAMSNELTALQPSSYPNPPGLGVYDGVTINPNSSTGQPYQSIGVRRWLTSASDYPDINGVMQSVTPYTPYSYKDFLYRLKAWAEHPSYEDGQLNFPFKCVFSSSGGGKHLFRITRYKGFFYGINVDMTPQEVYSHFHRMLRVFGAHSSSPSNNYTSEPITLSSSTLQSPHFVVHFGSAVPSNTQSMNNVVIGAPFETQFFDDNLHYYYTHGPSSQLPSGFESNGVKSTIMQKLEYCGALGMHSRGIDNCEGCEWGCWWDWKTQQKKCSDTQNRAFPFKEKTDCENFRAQHPGYLCEIHELPTATGIIDTHTLTGIEPTTTTTTTTTFTPLAPYDCDTSDCMYMPLTVPDPAYPTATVWNCGVKDFHFDYAQQSFWVEACGIAGSTITLSDTIGVIITSTTAASQPGFYLATILSPGKYTVTVECPNTTGISYWDICLEWETPPIMSTPGVLKEVHCVNRRTPCCPNPPCISQYPNVIQDLG